MSQRTESAKPLTDWLDMEKGFRYRWVLLSKEEVTTLREKIQRRLGNTEPSACKKDRYAV